MRRIDWKDVGLVVVITLFIVTLLAIVWLAFGGGSAPAAQTARPLNYPHCHGNGWHYNPRGHKVCNTRRHSHV